MSLVVHPDLNSQRFVSHSHTIGPPPRLQQFFQHEPDDWEEMTGSRFAF